MDSELWNKCIEYHGHVCGGIALGYMAAMYAKELMNIKVGDDINVISATDKCPVDAFPVILGCSRENGRLTVDCGNKMEFIIQNKTTGDKLILKTKPKPEGAAKGKDYWLNGRFDELFDVQYKQI